MVTTPGTIDLGELPRGEPIEAPWPVRERLRRLRSRHIRWTAMAAGLAALVIATTGAPSPQPSPALTLLFTVPATNFAVDDENLYVLSAPDTLTAYRLADGSVRWRRSSSFLTEYSWLDAWSGPLLVATYSASGGGDPSTTRFDTATGRPLWTSDGQLFGVAGDRVILDRLREVEPTIDHPVPPSDVTAVDLATGDPVWSVTLTSWHYQSEAGYLVGFAPDGRLSTYDLDTGERIARVRIGAPTGETQPVVAGSIVLLQDSGGATVTAYDVDTLARLWERPDRGGWLTACGRLVCSTGTGAPQAIHPDTGETVWSAEWAPEPGADEWLDIGDPEASWLDGHFMLSHSTGAGLDQRTWLVDQGTGEPVLDLRQWMFSYPLSGNEPPILLWYEDERTWVGRLREDLSGVRVLGTIDVSVSSELGYPACQSTAPYVICVDQLAPQPELRVWRIR